MPVCLLEHILLQKVLQPSAKLKQLIDCFILAPFTDSLALSDGFPTIIFTDATVVFSDGSIVKNGWLAGPYMENIHLTGKGSLLAVRFNPVTFSHLFNIDATELRTRNVWELTGIPGRLSHDVHEAENKIAKIEDFVLRLASKTTYTNHLLQQALTTIQHARGNIKMTDLNINYKWLERNFIKHIGITPKEYARQQRFIHTYTDLIKTDADLLTIALNNGYCDSSHFIKDFKRFTGFSPLAYLKKIPRP